MKKIVDGIGEVFFRKSERAKQLNITVKPFKSVVVSVPENLSFRKAEEVFFDKIAWVKKEKEKMREMEEKFTVFEVGMEYKLKKKTISILSSDKKEPFVEKKGNELLIYFPKSANILFDKYQSWLREIVESQIKQEAKEYLPTRVQELADQNGIPVNMVTIRKSTTRWGSCSPNNNVSLSYYLLLLPDHLIDYAILHELAHVKIKDHSRAYWMHLDQLVGGRAIQLDKEIKQEVIGVI